MNPLDIYVHKHSGLVSQCTISRAYEGYHLVAIHNLSSYFSFDNISARLGNNVFFYSPGNSIIIPDGCYSLATLNKHLDDTIVTQLYKIMIS